MLSHVNEITKDIIGSAIEVHRHLGPGLLESAYQECLARELIVRGIPFQRERPLRLDYKGIRLECGYRIDFVDCRLGGRGSDIDRGHSPCTRGTTSNLSAIRRLAYRPAY